MSFPIMESCTRKKYEHMLDSKLREDMIDFLDFQCFFLRFISPLPIYMLMIKAHYIYITKILQQHNFFYYLISLKSKVTNFKIKSY